MRLQTRFSRLCCACFGIGLGLSSLETARSSEKALPSKPVLLYSRHYSAIGEDRYAPDGAYRDVLERLGASFKVRVHDQPLTPQTLGDVRLLLIANPNEKAAGTNPPPPHILRRDIRALTRYVTKGGGLIVMLNQEDHNLEVENCNRLLSNFGITSTNLYTDVKLLVLPNETPVIGGLRWAYYSGNLLQLDPAHAAKPQAVVTNDLNQPLIAGTRDQAGVLLATARSGKGRVVVVTDSGWIADWALRGERESGVAIKEHDNWEIFRRLARWAARLEN
jgi:hypothetical protein